MISMDDIYGWYPWMISMDNIYGWYPWMISMDDIHGWYPRIISMDDMYGWYAWMICMDDIHGWYAWMIYMDEIHGWYTWMISMHDIHGARPGHARPDQTQNTSRFSVFWHEWASYRRYEGLDRCKMKDFSIAIDLTGSQRRFIGLEGGL